MKGKTGVLFVCLGNICRSPLAMAAFRAEVERAGLPGQFDIDSAGTSSYHLGSGPDPRTVATAAGRGLEVSHAARQLAHSDFERFDYIIAMDAGNLGKVLRLAREAGSKSRVHLLREFDAHARDDREVPDPYFGGAEGFAEVQEIVERCAAGLLTAIRRDLGWEGSGMGGVTAGGGPGR